MALGIGTHNNSYVELGGVCDIMHFGFKNIHTSTTFKNINKQFIMQVKDKFRMSQESLNPVMHKIIKDIIQIKLSDNEFIKHKITDPESGDVVTTDFNQTLSLSTTNSILIDITEMGNVKISEYLANYPFSSIDLDCNLDIAPLLAIKTIKPINKNIVCILPLPARPISREFRTVLEASLTVDGGVKTTLYMIEFFALDGIKSIIKVNISDAYSEGLFSIYHNFSEEGVSIIKYSDRFQMLSNKFIEFNNTQSQLIEQISNSEETIDMNIGYDLNTIKYTGGALCINNKSVESAVFEFKNIKEIDHICAPIYKSVTSDKDRSVLFGRLKDVTKYIQTKYSDEKLTKNISRYTMNVSIHRNNSVLFKDRFSKPEVNIGDINCITIQLGAFDNDDSIVYSFDIKENGNCIFKHHINENANRIIVEMGININCDLTDKLMYISIESLYNPGSKVFICRTSMFEDNKFNITTTLNSEGNINTMGVFSDIESFSISANVSGVSEYYSIEKIIFDGPILNESITNHSNMLSIHKEIIKRINESDTFNVSPNMSVGFNK